MSLLLDALKKAEQSQNKDTADEQAQHGADQDAAPQEQPAAEIGDTAAEASPAALTEDESEYSLGDFSTTESAAEPAPEPSAEEERLASPPSMEEALEFDQEFDEDHVNRLNAELSAGAAPGPETEEIFAVEEPVFQQAQHQVYYQLNDSRSGFANKKLLLGAVAVLAAVFVGLAYYIYEALNDLNASVTNPISATPPAANGTPQRRSVQKPAPTAATTVDASTDTRPETAARKPRTDTAVRTGRHTPTVSQASAPTPPATTATEPATKRTPTTAPDSTDSIQADRRAPEAATDKTPVTAKDDTAPAPASNARQDSEIKIVKYNMHSQLDRRLMNAYQLYRSGKYTQAQQAYQQILGTEPNQRDALLGLAAIAIRQKNLALASAYYKTLLRLNPKDSAALSGLMSVQAVPADANTIAHLKQLLRAQPTSAHLYYSLGNLYSARQRWLEAQNSYFNAHRYDRNNAVYAYNLAISLDRLGQGRAALPYYQLSLTLTKNRLNHANRLVVKRRIRQLKNGG